ncbi:MAG: hypothetical protein ACLFM7_13330 [Bacteroidales bacterium]
MKEHTIHAQGISDFEKKVNQFFNQNPFIEIKTIDPLKSEYHKKVQTLNHLKFVISIIYD